MPSEPANASADAPALPDHGQTRRDFLRWLTGGVPLVVLGGSALSGCGRVAGTGRRQFTMIPRSQMLSMSDDAWTQISADETECQHRETSDLVSRAGLRLAQQAPLAADAPARIVTFENPTVNAWALPNGRIAIYTGLLPYCRNEAAVAAVIGHEIAHVVARHGNERMTQQLTANALTVIAAVGLEAAEVDEDTRAISLAAIGIGGQLGVLLPYSRTHEYEADQLGLTYMARAGYDPREAVAFWQRFADMKNGQHPPEFFSTHPADANRIAAIEARMDQYLAEYRRAPTQHGRGAAIPAPYQQTS